MARSLLTLASAALLASSAAAKQCVAFDNSDALYAFGGSKDVSLGTASAWSSPSPKTLTNKGRPPFSGANTQCFTSAEGNTLVVVAGDAKNLGNVYLYNFSSKKWSTQKTTGHPDLAGASSVLDHDTNVLYTFTSGGAMWFLDLSGSVSHASSKTLKWKNMGHAGFNTKGYKPVLGEASQHILFFGGAGAAGKGEADIFVVHYASYQKKVVKLPSNGAALPAMHGQTAGIPYVSTGVAGDQVFYVPDDFSASYVVSHWTNPGHAGSAQDAPEKLAPFINTTQVFAAPPHHDKKAAYAASPSSIVQLDSAGHIAYANAIEHFAVARNAKWESMSYKLPGL